MAVPLGQVARITTGVGPARIDHLDRERTIAVEANTQGRALTEVLKDINTRVAAKVTFPAGYALRQGGESEDQAQVFGQIFAALGLAVLLMYFVLVVQFGSFLEPLAIMLSLPLSLIGVMLAMLATNTTLNLMSLIGVILLMGIVAKNAILLVDFAKWSEEAGMRRREAIIEAGRVRLRPDPDDDLRADCRHDADCHRRRRRRGLPRAAGPRRHRRRHHLDGPDAAGDPDLLRDPHGLARLAERQADGQGAGRARAHCLACARYAGDRGS